MWTDWVNSGYILIMIISSIINRVWAMIPILLGSIILAIVYKHHLGDTNFFDIQSAAVILQFGFIVIGVLISYAMNILQSVWSTFSFYVRVSGLVAGVYIGKYIYMTLFASIVQSIVSWFQSIPDKLLQTKVIVSLLGIFLLFPLIFYLLYQVAPNLYMLLRTNAIAIGVLDIILAIGSLIVYKSFSLPNVALLETIWACFLCLLFAGSYFFYQGVPFSQLEKLGIYCIGSGLGIGLLLLVLMLVWNILMQPWIWHIILWGILGGILFTVLVVLYKNIPPSIQLRIQSFWIWILTGMTHARHDMSTASALVWGAILIELYILFKLNKTYRIEVNQGTSIQEDQLSLSTSTGSININSSYVYGISFAVRLEPQPPDRSAASTVFTTILNYGEVPRVAYNASLNTLRITMKQQDGVRVVCDVEVPLQTLFTMYIGYDHGVVDIFYNGKLVQSKENVIPYFTNSILTMGAMDGLVGDISKVRVFTEALSYEKIKRL